MIEVVEPGLLTSVQTPIGRPGWRHLGVPVGGAVDPWSARLANRLVGNPEDAAVLEITLLGPTLRFTTSTMIAITGSPFETFVDERPIARFAAHAVQADAELGIGGGDGARAYLAVAGGIVVQPMLGSAATDLRSGFGGLDGRALRAGDRLEMRSTSTSALHRWSGTLPQGPIRIVDGPHAERLAPAALAHDAWTVGVATDRTGMRLDGPTLEPSDAEVPSMALPAGAIQVPPDGHPIVLLADRPVTGGYPVPACVIRADLGRVGQMLPGDQIRFVPVSVEEARAAYRAAEAELDALETIAPPEAEVGWTGALE